MEQNELNNDELAFRVLQGTATPAELERYRRLVAAGEMEEQKKDADYYRVFDAFENVDNGRLSREERRRRNSSQKEKAASLADVEDDLGIARMTVHVRHLWPTPWRVAASLAALIIVAGAGFWLALRQTPTAVNSKTIYTGYRYYTLPDGTKGVIEAESALAFARGFAKDHRDVILSGTASFDVTHDAKKPFIVTTKDVVVKVLGTAFEVEANPDSAYVKVTVGRGRVEVSNTSGKVYDVLTVGEEMVINTITGTFTKRNVAVILSEGRVKHLMNLSTGLADAAAVLSKKFGVKIMLKDGSIGKYDVHAQFIEEDMKLESSLKVILANISNVVYTLRPDGSVELQKVKKKKIR